jgi:hypothetical protein
MTTSATLAPFTYAVSTRHCLTVSLATGGTGVGTAWGQQRAHQMHADAGFGTVHDGPQIPATLSIFVTHWPENWPHPDQEATGAAPW